ncbi:MAG TPA: tryptophan--tRNA ligase [Nannocystaceae bacterium]|nr:tryptophan--tRNA ligase [Nannocystaceae bacterium]
MSDSGENAPTRDHSGLPPRVLSGLQPSGELHIGNYFGAIQQHIALQDEYPGECLFFIADYHALTSLRDPDVLRGYTRELAVTYLAFGFDLARAAMFRQSDVPEVTELTWLLSCVTGMGLLERAHSYKDKVARGIKPSAGLFFYPVLMAADILVYDSSMVPVGKDQVQHVEMAQDMATHFNEQFGRGAQLLRRPEWRLSHAPYVPGLDGAKMSKSYDNTIPIWSSGKDLRKRIGRIVTDSTPLGQPLPIESDKVLALLDLVLDERERAEVREWYRSGSRAGQPFGYGHAKQLLADRLDAYFADARARRELLLRDPGAVDEMLRQSATKARELAQRTLDRCRLATGLR